MVQINFTDSGDVIAFPGGTQTVYNNGDMAWILSSTALVMIM